MSSGIDESTSLWQADSDPVGDSAQPVTGAHASSPQPGAPTQATSPTVVELRIHGVSGTPPESILRDPSPEQVGGDDTGRIFRRREPISVEDYGERTVEAYHWGRYTAGSPTRALWLLLLPFAVVNLARFALLMPCKETEEGEVEKERKVRHKAADALLRLLGLVLTLTLVVTVCYLAWEVGARQCVDDSCAGQSNGMRWFGGLSAGIRVLVATLAPAAVVALVWSFGRRPALVEPPAASTQTPGTTAKPWKGNGRVGDPAFWRGAASAPAQRAAHVWASCAVIGLLALATVGYPTDVLKRTPWWADLIYICLAGMCFVGAAVALEVLIHDRKPEKIEPDPHGRDTLKIHPFHAYARWTMAAVAAACAAFAWRAIDTISPQRGTTDLFAAAANLVGVAAGLLLIVLFVLILFMAKGPESRELRGRVTPPGGRQVPPAFRPYWNGLGAWMLASLAVTLSFGFSTAAVFWVAGLLGNPMAPASDLKPPTGGGTGTPIEVAAGYWTAASVWGGLAVVAGVCLLPLAAWLLRRRPVYVSALVALALGLCAVGAALAGDGKDVVSASAVWFLLAGGALGAALFLVVRPHDGKTFGAIVHCDYKPTTAEHGAESKVVRTWRVAMARYRYQHVIGLVAVLGGLATIAWALVSTWALAFGDLAPRARSWNGPLNSLTALGVAAVTAIAAWLVSLGVATWRSPKMRTTVGILWDLVSFWPRVAHPLCPLPYGGRAVRAVAKRTSQLANDDLSQDQQGKFTRPYKTVVVSGHSQGTVIAQAACAVLYEQAHKNTADRWLPKDKAKRALDATCLVTYGSQLQFIYARLFPSYFGFALQYEVFEKMLQTRWRNLYRWTDPLGGPVLSWPYLVGKVGAHARYGPAVSLWKTMNCDDGTCEGHEAVRVDEPEFRKLQYRSWSIGPDIRLRDPGVVEDSPFAARLPAHGHSDYPADPGFDLVVAKLAAAARPLARDCSPPTPQGVVHGQQRRKNRNEPAIEST
jgi:hypothetical protein